MDRRLLLAFSAGGVITFWVESDDGIQEYNVPSNTTWEMLINSENAPGYWYNSKEWYPDFRISDGGYIQYRYSMYMDEYYMLHLGNWNKIYPNEYIESKTYTNF